ncbi:protein regulator of cytokinesis 1-like [Teleopsis dalmanni]|uniref:protein regulator of cytokinesis 1-like n=1 Tax=Teleopsis dalmanni TaxID=139649 RepID=UPI0018CD4EA3|nr:protein regulator of cytokinesis 1-like [Teleopsis dalmanni]
MAELIEVEKLLLKIEMTSKINVKKLLNIWIEIFPLEVCKEHLRKLVKHAESFYTELVSESEEKKVFIEKEINDLKDEAKNLHRLLNIEAELPCTDPDIPLLMQQSDLDKSLQDLRESLRQKREDIRELLLQQKSLCEELGVESQPLLEDPLPTENEINDFRKHLNELDTIRMSRLNDVSNLRKEIKDYLQILQLEVNTDNENKLLNHHQIKLDEETFNGLQYMHKRYGAKVQEVREGIDNMRQSLEKLWNLLNITTNTRNKFIHLNDYTQVAFDIYYKEIQRCEALKRQNIKFYIQQLREQITQWWDKTLKSEVERNRFSNFNNNYYTDDLLVLHELELDDLQTYYETNQEIFELFESRKILWERMMALENKATEPGRYNNRGGQLLKEEKERKTITTKLPIIERKITELVKIYKVREHKPFTVYGENIVDYMSNEWAQKRQAKEQRTNIRKNMQVKSQTRAISSKSNSVISTLNSPLITNSARKVSSSLKRKLPTINNNGPTVKRCLMESLNSLNICKRRPSIGVSSRKMLGVNNLTHFNGSNKKHSTLKKSPKTSSIAISKGTVIFTDQANGNFEKNNKSTDHSFMFNTSSGPVISEAIGKTQPTESERLLTLPNPRNLTYFLHTKP